MSRLINCQPVGFRPLLQNLSAPIPFSTLTDLASPSTTIHEHSANSQMNLHSYIVRFDSMFFAMWTRGPNGVPDETAEGLRVAYSTSSDAETWSAEAYITPAPASNFRYMARGFWVRNGEMIALASLDEADQGFFGDSLELRGFVWNGSSWDDTYLIADNTINNFPPELLSDGTWLMSRRDRDATVSWYKGDIGNWTNISVVEPVGVTLNEPIWHQLPNGALSAFFRDNESSHRLLRSNSGDLGLTWTTPKFTNFPDASSKSFSLRLSDGRYVLISNPDINGVRNPLCIAISDDGDSFDRMVVLRDEATSVTYPGTGKLPGYQYPHALEHNGVLHVIYTRNKEDIQITSVDLDDLP